MLSRRTPAHGILRGPIPTGELLGLHGFKNTGAVPATYFMVSFGLR
jgi:hypothetical protein